MWQEKLVAAVYVAGALSLLAFIAMSLIGSALFHAGIIEWR